ncbi:MAG: HAD family hydrolase [Christensenellaceae bacterium]|jgi:HAD superfamily hydrolase (TIGR01484 family)|nr:HAD family hydrolase [Christensenellaceae bacterium]
MQEFPLPGDLSPSNSVFVTDLDGTLLNSEGRLSAFSLQSLKALMEVGLRFTIATARSFVTAMPALGGLVPSAFAITHNGAHIVEPRGGEIVEGSPLSPAQYGAASELFRSRGIDFVCYSMLEGRERVSFLRTARGQSIEHYTVRQKGDPRLRMAENWDSLFDGEVFYLSCLMEPEFLAPIFEEIPRIGGLRANFMPDTYRPPYYWLEIMREEATKERGALRVKKLLGAKYLFCFGDNLNDLGMLRAADFGVAVENALLEVRAAAKLAARSNDGDGVARFLLDLFG